MDAITLRIATPDDADLLSRVGWETFHDTFVGEFAIPYPQADLDAFFADAYSPESCREQLETPGMRAWFAERDGAVVGFAQVGGMSLPHPDAAAGDGELKRLYLRRGAFGSGLATQLWETARAWLERDGTRPIWLSVWSENERAQRFYRRHGFEKAGEYGFRVGETVDHEFIFVRR